MPDTTGDLISSAKGFLPSGSTISTILIWFFAILIIGAIIGGIAWILIEKKRYARIIEIYEERNGYLTKIGEDKARIITVDKGLAKVWYLKKLKIPIQPMIYTSSRLHYPALRKADGDIVNFELKMDAVGQAIISKIIPNSIRMANANLRRYFRETYKKEGMWQKYGGMIIFISGIVLILIAFIYILSKVAEIVPALQNVANTLNNALQNVHCTSAPINGQIVTSG